MGLLSKRKTKKEAKKAQAATKTATAEAKAAAQAAAVPVGEIEIPHRQQQIIATNLSVPKGGRSGGGGVRGRSFRFRRRAVKCRKYDSSRGGGAGSPSDKSHHSVVSALSKDTGFPETPKRRLFQQPDPVDLLPSMHGDEADSGDLFKMPGLRTAGEIGCAFCLRRWLYWWILTRTRDVDFCGKMRSNAHLPCGRSCHVLLLRHRLAIEKICLQH